MRDDNDLDFYNGKLITCCGQFHVDLGLCKGCILCKKFDVCGNIYSIDVSKGYDIGCTTVLR